jgi:hypothetical protein
LIKKSNSKLNFNDIKQYVSTITGYKLLSNSYKNNTTKLKFECPNGHIFDMDWNHFKRGQRCSECDITKKKTYNEVKNYIESFDGYKLLSNTYVKCKEKMKIQCPNNHVFEMNYSAFNAGDRCPICAKCKKKTLEEIRYNMLIFGYALLSDTYVNSQTKLLVECPNHHTYEVHWGNFRSGKRCPICNNSKGEEKIRNILTLLNIDYILQKEFNNLLGLGHKKLSYDFYLPSYNLCIEYQGIQHYEPIQYFGGEEQFKNQQEHDRRKNEYAKTNNIKLLEIPYWEFDNIEEILKKELLLNY